MQTEYIYLVRKVMEPILFKMATHKRCLVASSEKQGLSIIVKMKSPLAILYEGLARSVVNRTVVELKISGSIESSLRTSKPRKSVFLS